MFTLNVKRPVRLGAHTSHLLERVCRQAVRLGLSFHVTASSGWPIVTPEASDQEMEHRVVKGEQRFQRAPYRDILNASFPSLFRQEEKPPTMIALHGEYSIMTAPTDRCPIGCALPLDVAYVADHLSIRAAKSAAAYAKRYLAPSRIPAESVLIDSFEQAGHLPTTENFLRAFQRRYGYDLLPWLPNITPRYGEVKYLEMLGSGIDESLRWPRRALAMPIRRGTINSVVKYLRSGENTCFEQENVEVRADYEEMRATLFLKFVREISMRLRASRVAQNVRIQGYGGFAHPLDVLMAADIPETETLYGGGNVEFMRLASSAAHVRGISVVSCETLICVHPKTTIPIETMLRLVLMSVAAGCTQLVYHGMPYPTADGWYPFEPSEEIGVPLTCDLSRVNESELRFLTEATTRLCRLMSYGRQRTDVLWITDGHRFADRVNLAHRRVVHSEASQTMMTRGVTYTQLSPTMLRRLQWRGGKPSVDGMLYQTVVVDPTVMQAVKDAVKRRRGDVRIVPATADELLRLAPALPIAVVGGPTLHVTMRARDDNHWQVFVFNDAPIACRARVFCRASFRLRLLYQCGPRADKRVTLEHDWISLPPDTGVVVRALLDSLSR